MWPADLVTSTDVILSKKVHFCAVNMQPVACARSLTHHPWKMPRLLSLTHYMSVVSSYTPWKYQKTRGFLMFSEGLEKYQWLERVKSSAKWSSLAFRSLFVFFVQNSGAYSHKTVLIKKSAVLFLLKNYANKTHEKSKLKLKSMLSWELFWGEESQIGEKEKWICEYMNKEYPPRSLLYEYTVSLIDDWSSRLEVFCKKGDYENFTKLTENYHSWALQLH